MSPHVAVPLRDGRWTGLTAPAATSGCHSQLRINTGAPYRGSAELGLNPWTIQGHWPRPDACFLWYLPVSPSMVPFLRPMPPGKGGIGCAGKVITAGSMSYRPAPPPACPPADGVRPCWGTQVSSPARTTAPGAAHHGASRCRRHMQRHLASASQSQRVDEGSQGGRYVAMRVVEIQALQAVAEPL